MAWDASHAWLLFLLGLVAQSILKTKSLHLKAKVSKNKEPQILVPSPDQKTVCLDITK